MDTLTTWWSALSTGLQIFYGIAFASTAIMAVQTLLTFLGADGEAGDLGLDGDGGLEGGADGDTGSGLPILSVRAILAFCMGFGWAGAWFEEKGWSPWLVLPGALLIGLVLMVAVAAIMKALFGLRSSGNLDFISAVGEVGTVYLPIPPRREGPGKVQVLVQGRLTVVDAFTPGEERLENRVRVRVIDVIGTNAVLVQPEEPLPA